MTSSNIYNPNLHNYITGFGHGYVTGYVKAICVEQTQQPASEINYLLLAKKIQKRIDKIMENYELSNKDDVQLFLHENPSIISLVNETNTKIHEYFSSVGKITLEVQTDPEENRKNLIAKVFSKLPIDDAMDKLDIFDQEWFASKFIESEMHFNVTLDYEE